jgi:hypothetical protein
MYDTSGLTEESAKVCKPDYEKVASKQLSDLTIIKQFKCSLIAFVSIIGSHSFKREASSIPELLGMVELDILNRQKQYERILELIEKDK